MIYKKTLHENIIFDIIFDQKNLDLIYNIQ